MQWKSTFPARRVLSFILAFVYLGLFGCGGGGGGNSASAPPTLTGPPGGSILSGGVAESLLSGVDGEGEAWIGLIEADSARLVHSGSDTDADADLNKLPPASLESQSIITTRYSGFAHFTSSIDAANQPGQYMQWGKLTPEIPDAEAEYALEGAWTCTGCNGHGSINHGKASGQLDVDFVTLSGQASLTGDGLDFSTGLGLDKSLIIQDAGSTSLGYNGVDIPLQDVMTSGGIFGPDANEAGLLFGLISEDRVFTGAAIGTRTP